MLTLRFRDSARVSVAAFAVLLVSLVGFDEGNGIDGRLGGGATWSTIFMTGAGAGSAGGPIDISGGEGVKFSGPDNTRFRCNGGTEAVESKSEHGVPLRLVLALGGPRLMPALEGSGIVREAGREPEPALIVRDAGREPELEATGVGLFWRQKSARISSRLSARSHCSMKDQERFCGVSPVDGSSFVPFSRIALAVFCNDCTFRRAISLCCAASFASDDTSVVTFEAKSARF